MSQIGSRGIPGQHGGVERVIEAVAPRLSDKGYGVTVYCADWSQSRPSTWRGVRLRYMWTIRTKHFDTLVRSFLACLRAAVSRDDVVHIHATGSAPFAIFPRLAGKKVVVTVHGLDWQRRKWGAVARLSLRLAEWAALHVPHRTVVVGPDLKTWLDERHGSDVTLIVNGVEDRVQREPNRILNLGLSRESYILFLARLVPEKQVHVLIEAWMGLAEKFGKTLAVAGPAWYSQGYADALKAQARDDKSVHFLGEVDEATLEELYSNCLAYVLPSEVEGMSLSLLDAMAYGACVICSDIPPNLAVVEAAGLSFPVGDVGALRSRLEQVLVDDGLVARLRVAAVARISAEFTWDRVTSAWDRLYQDITAKS